MKYLIIISIVFVVILITALLVYPSKPVSPYEELGFWDFLKDLFSKSQSKQEKAIQGLVEEETAKCLEYNLKATEEYCTDLAYHDIALIKEDISLCDEITHEILKNHCLRSLR